MLEKILRDDGYCRTSIHFHSYLFAVYFSLGRDGPRRMVPDHVRRQKIALTVGWRVGHHIRATFTSSFLFVTGRGNVARFSAGMASGITELAALSVVVSSATTETRPTSA